LLEIVRDIRTRKIKDILESVEKLKLLKFKLTIRFNNEDNFFLI